MRLLPGGLSPFPLLYSSSVADLAHGQGRKGKEGGGEKEWVVHRPICPQDWKILGHLSFQGLFGG